MLHLCARHENGKHPTAVVTVVRFDLFFFVSLSHVIQRVGSQLHAVSNEARNNYIVDKSVEELVRENETLWELAKLEIRLKKLVKQQGSREQNVLFRETGSSKTLLTIREQIGIRTNGILEQKSLRKKRKWVPICSRAYCT